MKENHIPHENSCTSCFSCTDCGAMHCGMQNSKYPEFCLTAELDQDELDSIVQLYKEDEINEKIAIAAAEIEGGFYGVYTRVEETVVFARRIGAKKIGIATCMGLADESRVLAKILKLNGFEVYGVLCKAGAVDKTAIGLAEEDVGDYRIMCNPILQAKLLNKANVDLNVVVGLCVGHDSLFYKYAEAPCTTLVVKDRVLAHNPVGPLHETKFFYKRLLENPIED